MTLAPSQSVEAKPQIMPTVENLQSLEQFAGRKRWTRDDCSLLERLGMLVNRYELIDGEILEKVGQNRPHAIAVTLIIKWLISLFGGDFVQCQIPVEVADADRPTYQPEPDATVTAQPASAYPSDAPGPGDLRLVVEVSDTTLRDDLTVKANLYARAGVPEYWVLDVTGRQLFVHSNPANGSYAHVERCRETETVATEAAADKSTLVSNLLPPVSAESTA